MSAQRKQTVVSCLALCLNQGSLFLLVQCPPPHVWKAKDHYFFPVIVQRSKADVIGSCTASHGLWLTMTCKYRLHIRQVPIFFNFPTVPITSYLQPRCLSVLQCKTFSSTILCLHPSTSLSTPLFFSFPSEKILFLKKAFETEHIPQGLFVDVPALISISQ